MRTIFPTENGESIPADTVLTQETPESVAESERDVKFPKRCKVRGKVLASIYRPSASYPNYRVAWTVGRKRMMKGFHHYGEAKRHADTLVKDLAKGSRVTALTPSQADDALAAFDKLQNYYQSTGRKLSLLGAVSECVESAGKLNGTGHSLGEAVDGFLRTVVSVKRMDIGQAVEQLIGSEVPRTKASNGQRAQLCGKYAYNRAIMLRRFAGAFPGTALADLTKEHLDLFMGSLAEIKTKSKNGRTATSAKSRNHHRATIRQLLAWAVRKDFLSATHRLCEADGLRPEHANTSEVLLYTPAELKALLDTAEGPMRAMIAIGGLAGLRTQELLRLSWDDVRKVENHIEITSGKSKTRQRRLVEIVPALAEWLEPFSESTGKLCNMHEITWQQHFVKLCKKAQVEIKGKKVPVIRKPNGLRHAFCSYHFALHGNENNTAMQAGNSPGIVHGHYKGLATKKEAEAWFAVSPEKAVNIPMKADRGE